MKKFTVVRTGAEMEEKSTLKKGNEHRCITCEQKSMKIKADSNCTIDEFISAWGFVVQRLQTPKPQLVEI
jgi:predicted methyltransferase